MSGVGAGPGFEGQHLNDAQWSSEVEGASTGLSSTSLNKSPSVFIVIRVMSHQWCTEVLGEL